MFWGLLIGCWLWGSLTFIAPMEKQNARVSDQVCVADDQDRYCYGGRLGPSEAWEERDWIVSIESLETGQTTVFGESTPWYEDVWFLALLGDRQALLVIDRQRYVSEFSVMMYDSTEMVWLDANEGVYQRVTLDFRPVDAIAFDHRLWLFHDDDGWFEVRDDGAFQALPTRWEQLFGARVFAQTTVRWQSPGGLETDVGMGLDQLVWTTKAGMEFRLPAVVHPIISGIPDGGETSEAFEIHAPGAIFVNGMPYMPGTLVNEPGNHRFVIEGANGYQTTFDVVLHPVVLGLPESGSTTKTIRIYANATMLLNGSAYSSGTPITQANRYVLTLVGVNGYNVTRSFVLAPSARGVSANTTYDSPLEITINGQGLLNGVPVQGTIVVHQNGEYELALMIDDLVVSRLLFTLEIPPPPIADEHVDDVSILQIGLGLLALVGLFLVLKKR